MTRPVFTPMWSSSPCPAGGSPARNSGTPIRPRSKAYVPEVPATKPAEYIPPDVRQDPRRHRRVEDRGQGGRPRRRGGEGVRRRPDHLLGGVLGQGRDGRRRGERP